MKQIQIQDLTFEVFITQEAVQQRVKELGAALATQFKDQNPLFIGILNGAFIFMADLIRACPIASEVTFMKVQSYAGLQSTGTITTNIGLQEDIKGRAVILVEDIIDTGTTLHHLLPDLQKLGPSSISLVSLLVKPSALKYSLTIDYKGFEIPNKFVIGYGLDYNGQARNLLDIYQLKE